MQDKNFYKDNLGSKEKFKLKIEREISSLKEKQINPDNIFDFYNDFLDGLIKISDNVLNKYIKDTRVPNKLDREKGLQEDEAFNYFRLNSIPEIIDSMSFIITERESRFEKMKKEIINRSKIDPRLFVPPEQDEKYIVVAGNGEGMEEKRNIPRLLTLVYILENDLDLKLEECKDITITEGITVSNMMRKIPYVRVLIPELERIVYICDEEGNASFIFDKKFVDENNIILESFDETSKPDFKEIIESNKNSGVRVVQSKNWRERIITALTKNISEFETQKSQPKSDLENKEDIPVKKEGWESASSLKKLFNVSQYKIEAFFENYKNIHPEWYEVQRVRGGAFEHYSPELISIFKKYIEENLKNFMSEMKSEGWLETNYLCKKFNIQYRTCLKLLEEFRPNHPEWFKTPIDSKTELYDKNIEIELEKKLNIKKEIMNKIPLKKEGWQCMADIVTKTGEFSNTITKLIKKLDLENKNLIEKQKYFVKIGSKDIEKVGIFYHPILIKKIEDYINKKNIKMESIPEKKDGWLNIYNLVLSLKAKRVSTDAINTFVKPYRLSNPEYFETQKLPEFFKGKKVYRSYSEYFHPDLVVKILNYFNNIILKEDGWESASSLHKELKTKPYQVMSFSETYRQRHPEWFKLQKSGGFILEHYHPELVEIIKEHFENRNGNKTKQF